MLISRCSSRHNGVQFFISHLARWLRTRRFSEPTFRPSGATNHWKNAVFRDFPTFSCTCIFFLLTLSLLSSSLFFSSLFYSSLLSDLSISAFHLSILSEAWLLNFLRSFIYISPFIRLIHYLRFFFKSSGKVNQAWAGSSHPGCNFWIFLGGVSAQ